MHCPSFKVVSFAMFSGVLMAEIMGSIRDVSMHLSKQQDGMYRSTVALEWWLHECHYNEDHEATKWISIGPSISLHLWYVTCTHYLLYVINMFVFSTCSMLYHHIVILNHMCDITFKLYLHIIMYLFHNRSLCILSSPPRFLLREAKFLPRCGEGPARRKAVKRPCDLDPIGFPVEVSETPWNQHNTWNYAILKGKSSEILKDPYFSGVHVDVSGRVGVNSI